jgi:hypothetical protein
MSFWLRKKERSLILVKTYYHNTNNVKANNMLFDLNKENTKNNFLFVRFGWGKLPGQFMPRKVGVVLLHTPTVPHVEEN